MKVYKFYVDGRMLEGELDGGNSQANKGVIRHLLDLPDTVQVLQSVNRFMGEQARWFVRKQPAARMAAESFNSLATDFRRKELDDDTAADLRGPVVVVVGELAELRELEP